MQLIKLRGKQGFVTLVDDEDYESLMQRNWSIKRCRDRFYVIESGKPHIFMHRELLGLKAGDGVLGDHRNGNTFDHRRANLRRATQTQNMQNSRTPVTNLSGYKGVWKGKKGKFRAGIRINKRSVCLGTFLTAIEAAKAYDDAALKHHGDFARVNLPLPENN